MNEHHHHHDDEVEDESSLLQTVKYTPLVVCHFVKLTGYNNV
jgi:hypothetical protein